MQFTLFRLSSQMNLIRLPRIIDELKKVATNVRIKKGCHEYTN